MLLSQLTSNYMDSDSITNPFTQSKDIHTIVGRTHMLIIQNLKTMKKAGYYIIYF